MMDAGSSGWEGIPDYGLDWLDASGSDAGIVLSTRVRLARNLQGHAFGRRARTNDRLAVLSEVRQGLKEIPGLQASEIQEMVDTPERLRQILLLYLVLVI